MRRALLITVFFLVAADASAQRIRDMSLSPEETMQQPDITRTQQGWNNNQAPEPIGPVGSPTIKPRLPGEFAEDERFPTDGFMEGYCDPDFRPLVDIGRNAGLSCPESIKQQACEGFRRLPQEAKNVLDRMVSCAYAAGENEDDMHSDNCGSNHERQQLKLLKKYWNNTEAAYTILFLPDMVQNAGSFCQGDRVF